MQLQQINDEGQALESGLEVFVSIPIYSGEYLAYGSSFLLQTIADTSDYASPAADYAMGVIGNAPATTTGVWYRYHTEGTSYPSVTAPSTSTNMLTMLGVNDDSIPSHSGMYQKLSGLLVGWEYEVTINFHYTTNVGTVSFSTFYYPNQNLTDPFQTEVVTQELPSSQARFTFIAKSTNDIVFFDYSTTEESSSCFISSIEIKEQNDYLISVVADIPRAGLSKVLRRKYNETIPLDEGETKE